MRCGGLLCLCRLDVQFSRSVSRPAFCLFLRQQIRGASAIFLDFSFGSEQLFQGATIRA